MTPLERVATALQHKEGDRVAAGPLVCGASRRIYGVTYAEWAQDAELQAKSMLQAQDLIGMDGCLQLVDLSVEAADFGQEFGGMGSFRTSVLAECHVGGFLWLAGRPCRQVRQCCRLPGARMVPAFAACGNAWAGARDKPYANVYRSAT